MNLSWLPRITAFVVVLSLYGCIHTAPFRNESSDLTLPRTSTAEEIEPIGRSEYLTVDDAKLYLLTRGKDRHAPVLLWLHGGPGGAERPLFRYFNSELENHFVVAYWDQRGAGRSFDADADPHQLTVSRHLADLDAVVDHLRKVLRHDTIALIGHSWGGMLGLLYVQQHPEKVSAFVAVAPLIVPLRAQQAEYNFVSTEARIRKEESVLTRLQGIGPPAYDTHDRLLELEDLADRYGMVWHRKPCKICVVLKGLVTGLVTPFELMSIHRGIHTSLDAMTPELLGLDLARTVPCVDIPVWFFLGRHDRHVDSRIAANYFDSLHAPYTHLLWFEESAHNIPFEEPEKFNRVMIEEALPGATGSKSCAWRFYELHPPGNRCLIERLYIDCMAL